MSKVNSKNLHIIARDGQWIIKKEGENHCLSSYKTQKEARSVATEWARKSEGEVIIHSRDGRIRERDSYSSDPLPQKNDRIVLYPVTSTSGSKVKLRKAVQDTISIKDSRG